MKLNEIKLGEILVLDGEDYEFKGFESEKNRMGKQTVYVFTGKENPNEKKTFSLSYQTAIVEKISDGRYQFKNLKIK